MSETSHRIQCECEAIPAESDSKGLANTPKRQTLHGAPNERFGGKIPKNPKTGEQGAWADTIDLLGLGTSC